MPRSGWFQSNLDGFGNLDNIGIFSLGEYKGSLFAGTRNIVTGAEIWKLVDGDWLKVMEGGFGSAANQAIDHLIEFKGQLYASTWNVASDTASYGTEIWRFDGDGEWEKVVSAGFGEVNNGESTLVVYKDRLYAGTWALDPNLRPPEIWASKTGDADDWVLVLQGGITEGNYGVVCFSEYDGYLYAGTANFSGAQVWRTKDGSTWEQVAVNGIDDPANMSVTAVEEYQEYLYASVGTSWDAPRAQVWRCKECDGNDWALVKSGGYHYPDTWRKGALEVYHGDLYQVIGNQEYGLEVWCTTDGMNWEEVIFEGFGDKKNIYTYFDNAILVFDDRLYLGVDKLAGEGGGEIWSGFLP